MANLLQLPTDRELAELRVGLDKKIFDSLWAEGQSMNMDDAIDFALGQGAR